MGKVDRRAAEEVLQQRADEPHVLRELLLTWQALMNVCSRRVGMPPARFGLLRALGVGPPEGLGVMALSRQLGVNAAAVTRQVKEMEARGLIERLPDPADARRHAITLSEKGVRAFGELHERMHVFEAMLINGVPESDMATTVAVLAQVRAAAEAMT